MGRTRHPGGGTGTAVAALPRVPCPAWGALEAPGGCRGTAPPGSDLPLPVEHPSAGRASRCRSISWGRDARGEPIPRGKGHSGRVEGRIRLVLTSPARVPAAEERHGPAPAPLPEPRTPHPEPRARPSALPAGATTAGRGGRGPHHRGTAGDTAPRTGLWGSPAAWPCPHPCRHRGDRAHPPPGMASLTLIIPGLLPAPSCLPFPPVGSHPRDLHPHPHPHPSSSILLSHLLDPALRISILTLIFPGLLPAPSSHHLPPAGPCPSEQDPASVSPWVCPVCSGPQAQPSDVDGAFPQLRQCATNSL